MIMYEWQSALVEESPCAEVFATLLALPLGYDKYQSVVYLPTERTHECTTNSSVVTVVPMF